MDIEKVINNLALVVDVIPDYTEGRSRGLTAKETEQLSFKSISDAINMMEKLERENQWLYGKLNMISDIIHNYTQEGNDDK